MKDRRALRAQIAAYLREANFAALVALAGRNPAVAQLLLQFIYDPGDLLHWRALEGLGLVAGAHPEQVRKVLGRLLWLLNEDSGSFGWGAAAALGEIARHQLPLMQEIVSMFHGFLEEDFSRGPMLWGLGRLGEVHPEQLRETAPLIIAALGEADPQVRAWAAWCLGKARIKDAAPGLQALAADHSPVQIYDEGQLEETTVSRIARQALAALTQAG